MKKDKQLWLLACGNGAGKSTFYRTRLEPLRLPFVNADILAKQLYPEQPEQHSYEVAKIAEAMRTQLLRLGGHHVPEDKVRSRIECSAGITAM